MESAVPYLVALIGKPQAHPDGGQRPRGPRPGGGGGIHRERPFLHTESTPKRANTLNNLKDRSMITGPSDLAPTVPVSSRGAGEEAFRAHVAGRIPGHGPGGDPRTFRQEQPQSCSLGGVIQLPDSMLRGHGPLRMDPADPGRRGSHPHWTLCRKAPSFCGVPGSGLFIAGNPVS